MGELHGMMTGHPDIPAFWTCNALRRGLLLWSVLLLIVTVSPYNETWADSHNDNSKDQLVLNEEPILYDREYEIMGYSSRPSADPVARLFQRLQNEDIKLSFEPERGYLDEVLRLLDIPHESQTLVYSATSLNAAIITAYTPRAIYFNDDTYVAWVPYSEALEIASMDPDLGPVFYTLKQTPELEVNTDLNREGNQCLRCHDSLTLTGGGVPRFILGSGYSYFNGSLVSHEGWILTDQNTPIRFRWGGWYVTGHHGNQVHLGNIVVKRPEELQDLEAMRKGNLDDLSGLVDTSKYLSNSSDIVALMILEHQVHIQNMITRVNYDVRRELNIPPGQGGAESTDAQISQFIKTTVEPLLAAMFMKDEAELTSQMSSTTGFTEIFEQRGPFDKQGRSLRQLDLETRMFRFPLSYLIYSEAFDNLPVPVKRYMYTRIREIVTGQDSSENFDHLSDDDKRAIREILSSTLPEIAL
jgi:hypothetical protein